ncbi:MAG: hypothetical protein E6K72_07020 [Candidatus Eisenbacteria bacterium]|uniref:Uncharacterized protein n=1 Tax=Eiseniibacteriota bacterium TaxID=2212470 RepID=A0A538SUH0_UNCEI|nr:MAG: hypothetical protein E6K72_07020 [Candidatus Eisenbacteria bacterium]
MGEANGNPGWLSGWVATVHLNSPLPRTGAVLVKANPEELTQRAASFPHFPSLFSPWTPSQLLPEVAAMIVPVVWKSTRPSNVSARFPFVKTSSGFAPMSVPNHSALDPIVM